MGKLLVLKKLLFLLSLICLSGCELESYDGDERFVVDLKIVDRSGTSISGQRMFVRVKNRYFGATFDTIEQATSDENGNLKIIFPRKYGPIDLQIGVAGNEIFQTRIHRSLGRSDFPGYVYALSEFEIFRNDEVTTLRIVPQQTSGATLVTFSIEGETADIFFGDWDVPENAPPEDYFQVFRNSSLTLHYILEENGVQTEYSTPIDIGTEPLTFTLSY